MEERLLNCRNSNYTQRSYSGKYGFDDKIYSVTPADYKTVNFFIKCN
jgi:hypothetical protein